MEFLIVGIGGFFGSISRYLVYLLEKRFSPAFPFGTLFINTLGCVLAGLCLAWASRALPQHKQLLLMIMMGYIGSFTTFSTFSVETFELIKTHQFVLAAVSVGLNLGLGLMAVWFGVKLLQG
jgi:CrcB protein